MRRVRALLLATAFVATACSSGGFFRQYEYEEDIYLSLDGSATVYVNSSLAIAIGYPDLVASINVTINQTGQAIENVLIIMAAYLSVSLSISAFMNWYNKRIALRER